MSCCNKNRENFVEGAMGISSPDGLYDNVGMSGMRTPAGMKEKYIKAMGYIPDLSLKPKTINQALPSGLSGKEYESNRGLNREYYGSCGSSSSQSLKPRGSKGRAIKQKVSKSRQMGQNSMAKQHAIDAAKYASFKARGPIVEKYCGSPGNLPGAMPGLMLPQYAPTFKENFNVSSYAPKAMPMTNNKMVSKRIVSPQSLYKNSIASSISTARSMPLRATPLRSSNMPSCPSGSQYKPNFPGADKNGCVKKSNNYQAIHPGMF